VLPDEYTSHDALGLAALVHAGEVTPSEVLDAALAAVQSYDADVSAIAALHVDRAVEALGQGLPDGPFTGVPFVVKDLWTDWAGTVTTNGSALWGNARPAGRDAEVVARYRRAGLLLFARTTTPELGVSPTTEAASYGRPTRNPWQLDRTPGGSSGGAAAAVAAGIVPMAHATDGGGSIRLPAGRCGLFGLKPTRARVPSGPQRGEAWGGLSGQHVVSRTVRDSAAALDVAAGPMPGDPYWAPPGPTSYLAETTLEPPRLRVGVCVQAPTGADVDPVCADAAYATGRRLEALGHEVVEIAWPMPPEQVSAAHAPVIPAHVAAAVDARLIELGRALQPGDLEPVTTAFVEWGRQVSATQYLAAVAAMHRLGRAVGELFEQVDLVVTPTSGSRHSRIGELDGSDVDRFLAGVMSVAAFTGLANLTGQPAMSLPLDTDGDGLPVGTQVLGRFGDDALLLRLAAQVERAHPWTGLAPRPLAVAQEVMQ
jgi:amidase